MKKGGKKNRGIVATIVGALLLFVGLIQAFKQPAIDPNEGGRLDAFAQCTNDKGLKMYGTNRCPHCQNMKKMFGTAFEKVNYIDCDAQKVQCEVANIEGYPTWMFNGTPYPGEKTLEELAAITNCELPVEQTTSE